MGAGGVEARLTFCFFAEDTGILAGRDAFPDTIERMSAKDGSNTHEVIREVFRAMNVERDARKAEGVPRWAAACPHANGGLFSDSPDVPRFSRVARSCLLNVGRLDWKKINPDIFGSMIQAVADEGERGELGMHCTSVPNILKVLEPLFLNDLRSRLAEAGTNARKLLNLRRRMARIRVFDPACGSGNFLVVACKEMRGIEAEVNRRMGEPRRQTVIRLTNFRGIEIPGFAAEIARLALIIAEHRCDMLHRGGQYALAEFLPLDARNWIACGNALRLDWLQLCPSAGTVARARVDTLLDEPTDRSEVDFANAGGETYICSNPPYRGSHSGRQTGRQKAGLKAVFEGRTKHWKSLDYVSGWFMKAADYGAKTGAVRPLSDIATHCGCVCGAWVWRRGCHGSDFSACRSGSATRPSFWGMGASSQAVPSVELSSAACACGLRPGGGDDNSRRPVRRFVRANHPAEGACRAGTESQS